MYTSRWHILTRVKTQKYASQPGVAGLTMRDLDEEDIAALFGCQEALPDDVDAQPQQPAVDTSAHTSAHTTVTTQPQQRVVYTPAVAHPAAVTQPTNVLRKVRDCHIHQNVQSTTHIPTNTQEALRMALSLFNGKASRVLPTQAPPPKRVHRPRTPSSPPHPTSSPLSMNALRAAMDGAGVYMCCYISSAGRAQTHTHTHTHTHTL